jgi:hypothetical protein
MPKKTKAPKLEIVEGTVTETASNCGCKTIHRPENCPPPNPPPLSDKRKTVTDSTIEFAEPKPVKKMPTSVKLYELKQVFKYTEPDEPREREVDIKNLAFGARDFAVLVNQVCLDCEAKMIVLGKIMDAYRMANALIDTPPPETGHKKKDDSFFDTINNHG